MFSFDESKSASKLNFNFSKLQQPKQFLDRDSNEHRTFPKEGEQQLPRLPNPVRSVVDVLMKLGKSPLQLFEMFKGHGAAVTVASLIQAMAQCGVQMGEEDAREVISVGDKNKDKTLRQIEWEAFCATQFPSGYLDQFNTSRRPKKRMDMEDHTQHMLVEITKTIMSSDSSLSSLFKKLCVSGGRRMTRDDLIEALKDFGIQLGIPEAQSLIQPFDKTGQGLSRAEFIRFINCGKSLA